MVDGSYNFLRRIWENYMFGAKTYRCAETTPSEISKGYNSETKSRITKGLLGGDCTGIWPITLKKNSRPGIKCRGCRSWQKFTDCRWIVPPCFTKVTDNLQIIHQSKDLIELSLKKFSLIFSDHFEKSYKTPKVQNDLKILGPLSGRVAPIGCNYKSAYERLNRSNFFFIC